MSDETKSEKAQEPKAEPAKGSPQPPPEPKVEPKDPPKASAPKPQPKPKAEPGMARCRCRSRVIHAGKIYEPGEKLTLPEDVALASPELFDLL